MTEAGYEIEVDLHDGRRAGVFPLLFGAAMINVSSQTLWRIGYVEEHFYFKTVAEAIAALGEWTAFDLAEPPGWIRHVPSNRRRPDGDPAREHIQP